MMADADPAGDVATDVGFNRWRAILGKNGREPPDLALDRPDFLLGVIAKSIF